MCIHLLKIFVLVEAVNKILVHSATAVSHRSFTVYQAGKLFNLNNITVLNFNNAHKTIILKIPYRVFSKLVHGGVTCCGGQADENMWTQQ